MDEILFFKRKYNCGVIHNGIRYMVGIERNNTSCFMEPIISRSEETTKMVITENTDTNTRVITDEFGDCVTAYRELERYNRVKIKHAYYFVDTLDSFIHSQTIESVFAC